MITANLRGILAAVTVLLVVSGVTLVGAALVHQQHSAPPGPSRADSHVTQPDLPPTAARPVSGPVLPASVPVSLTIPAIIAGHVDSATEPSSIFFRLGSLRPPDRVLVRRSDNTVAIFEVDEVRSFRKTRFPSRLVYGDTDHAALRLITCGGPLDSAGHYRDNVVVMASLVGSRAAATVALAVASRHIQRAGSAGPFD